MVHKKLNLPQKICLACQKPFAWRKKWQKDWEQVKYCSHRCQKNSSTKNSPKKILIISLFFLSMTISNKKLFAQICEIPAKETSSKNIEHKNVYGEELQNCCLDPLTGYFRDGFCKTNNQDIGTHVVCAKITDEFLNFTLSRGNDLISPAPQYNFRGLKAGDFWCLCALRWLEAHEAGKAPKINLKATNQKVLEYIDLETLEKYRL